MILLLALAIWTVDRVEPPWAVLSGPADAEAVVPLASLPPGSDEGTWLASPRGPIVGPPDRARRARAARVARLAGLATARSSGQGGSMGRRRQDHLARRAKREGFQARSVYKLEEIHRRVRLFRRGQRVLDLGCAPGSWTQYAAKAVGPRGAVVGIDLTPVTGVRGDNIRLLVGDAFETEPEVLRDGGPLFDVVLSDMAPATTGNRLADHVRSIDLCRRALHIADAVLRPGGTFVCKAFEGEDLDGLVTEVRARFGTVRRVKPRATRSESVELFVVGQDRRAES